MADRGPTLSELNDRSRAIFRHLVETYLETGDPVGSRTLSRTVPMGLSPATIRNVMQDLEELGLLGSPHTSAGRIPTQMGLRLFVDAVLQIGDLGDEARATIEQGLSARDDDIATMLDEAGALLSGLSHCASLVFAPKIEAPIQHLEFLSVGMDKSLAVLVLEDGTVENRVFETPRGLTQSAMRQAANFLNAHLRGRTLREAEAVARREMATRRAELDTLAAGLVERGIALWSAEAPGAPERLIVRGRANLLDPGQGAAELERVRQLFDDLERKRDLAHLLGLTDEATGVRVFIGSENKLFSLSGSSVVVSPLTDPQHRIVGAIGVIGPTRLNYGRIVPIVDYTARRVGQMLARGGAADGGRADPARAGDKQE